MAGERHVEDVRGVVDQELRAGLHQPDQPRQQAARRLAHSGRRDDRRMALKRGQRDTGRQHHQPPDADQQERLVRLFEVQPNRRRRQDGEGL